MDKIEFILAVRAKLWEKYKIIMSNEEEGFAELEYLATNTTPEQTARNIAIDFHGESD